MTPEDTARQIAAWLRVKADEHRKRCNHHLSRPGLDAQLRAHEHGWAATYTDEYADDIERGRWMPPT